MVTEDKKPYLQTMQSGERRHVVEGLTDRDMEPQPESLWWTSSYKAEVETTPEEGGRRRSWEMPFVDVFDLLGYSVSKKWVEHPRGGKDVARRWAAGGGSHTSTERRVCR